MGGNGDSAQSVIKTPGSLQDQNQMQQAYTNKNLQGLLSKYGSGGMNLNQALQGAQAATAATREDRNPYLQQYANSGLTPAQNAADRAQQQQNAERWDSEHKGPSLGASEYNSFVQQLATNPLTGSKLATDQVQSNPILGQLFGQGGTMDRTNAEEQRLSSQGFQLTPEDREAYGQASGDISRMFGQSENSLSRSLASRGLSSGASGAAGAQFSGLQGNKNEMLAQSQMQIANQRMNNTMQRLGQTRQFLGQLGSQGENAIQSQYGRNMSGVENAQNEQNKNINNVMAQQGQEQAQNNTAFSQEQQTKGPGLGGVLGAVGGGVLGAATGGIGAGIGASLGKTIGGAIGGGGSGAQVQNPGQGPVNYAPGQNYRPY